MYWNVIKHLKSFIHLQACFLFNEMPQHSEGNSMMHSIMKWFYHTLLTHAFADHSSIQINSNTFFQWGNALERNSLAWKNGIEIWHFGIHSDRSYDFRFASFFFFFYRHDRYLKQWSRHNTIPTISWGLTPSDQFEWSEAILWKLDFTVSPHSNESRWLDKVWKVMNVIPKYFDGMSAFVHCYYC